MGDTGLSMAKISVWWDIENCHVPRTVDPNSVALNINVALKHARLQGPMSINAFGDTNLLEGKTQEALSSTGINLNHVPRGNKEAADKAILVGMLLWALENPPPAHIALISGDGDFANALHRLRQKRYEIHLVRPDQPVKPALSGAAVNVWFWSNIARGKLTSEIGTEQILPQKLLYDASLDFPDSTNNTCSKCCTESSISLHRTPSQVSSLSTISTASSAISLPNAIEETAVNKGNDIGISINDPLSIVDVDKHTIVQEGYPILSNLVPFETSKMGSLDPPLVKPFDEAKRRDPPPNFIDLVTREKATPETPLGSREFSSGIVLPLQEERIKASVVEEKPLKKKRARTRKNKQETPEKSKPVLGSCEFSLGAVLPSQEEEGTRASIVEEKLLKKVVAQTRKSKPETPLGSCEFSSGIVLPLQEEEEEERMNASVVEEKPLKKEKAQAKNSKPETPEKSKLETSVGSCEFSLGIALPLQEDGTKASVVKEKPLKKEKAQAENSKPETPEKSKLETSLGSCELSLGIALPLQEEGMKASVMEEKPLKMENAQAKNSKPETPEKSKLETSVGSCEFSSRIALPLQEGMKASVVEEKPLKKDKAQAKNSKLETSEKSKVETSVGSCEFSSRIALPLQEGMKASVVEEKPLKKKKAQDKNSKPETPEKSKPETSLGSCEFSSGIVLPLQEGMKASVVEEKPLKKKAQAKNSKPETAEKSKPETSLGSCEFSSGIVLPLQGEKASVVEEKPLKNRNVAQTKTPTLPSSPGKEAILKELRGWLVKVLTTKKDYDVCLLRRDFLTETGISLDYKELGCSKLQDVLQKFADILRIDTHQKGHKVLNLTSSSDTTKEGGVATETSLRKEIEDLDTLKSWLKYVLGYVQDGYNIAHIHQDFLFASGINLNEKGLHITHLKELLKQWSSFVYLDVSQSPPLAYPISKTPGGKPSIPSKVKNSSK